jgi:hypothetical protein
VGVGVEGGGSDVFTKKVAYLTLCTYLIGLRIATNLKNLEEPRFFKHAVLDQQAYLRIVTCEPGRPDFCFLLGAPGGANPRLGLLRFLTSNQLLCKLRISLQLSGLVFLATCGSDFVGLCMKIRDKISEVARPFG